MELSQLKAILALQELASLARVGERLHLSPSAVFCQIRQLEEEIGQKVYERVGKRLRLTASGELLAQRASTILAAHDSALASIRAQGGGRQEVLRFGCGPHSSLRVVPHLLRAFLAAYPQTEVRVATSDDYSLLRDLRLGLLDAILMSMPVRDRQLCEEPLWSYEMVFVLPPARHGKRPTLSDLRNTPFILYRRAVVIDAGFKQMCRELKIEPNVVMENDVVDSIKELVKLGLGATLLPLWSVADERQRGLLRILRPPVRRFHNYGVLYRKSEYQPRILSALLIVARNWRNWWPLAKHVSPPLS